MFRLEPLTYIATVLPPEPDRPKAIRVEGLAYARVRLSQLESGVVKADGTVDRSIVLLFSWPHLVLATMEITAVFTSSDTDTTALELAAPTTHVSMKSTDEVPAVVTAPQLMTDQPAGAQRMGQKGISIVHFTRA